MLPEIMIVIRSVLFNAFFYLTSFLFCLLGGVLIFIVPQKTLCLVRTWAKIILCGLRFFCGVSFQIENEAGLPAEGEAGILASQHQSAFDTIIWLTYYQRPVYVLKAELLRIPIYGKMVKPAGMIAVDRQGGAKSLRQLLADALEALAQNKVMIIFPEGTRSRFGEVAPLQPGVAAVSVRTKTPLTPLATDSGRYWGRSFIKRPGVIRIKVGEKLDPDLSREEILTSLSQFYQDFSQEEIG